MRSPGLGAFPPPFPYGYSGVGEWGGNRLVPIASKPAGRGQQWRRALVTESRLPAFEEWLTEHLGAPVKVKLMPAIPEPVPALPPDVSTVVDRIPPRAVAEPSSDTPSCPDPGDDGRCLVPAGLPRAAEATAHIAEPPVTESIIHPASTICPSVVAWPAACGRPSSATSGTLYTPQSAPGKLNAFRQPPSCCPPRPG